jgi:hypothetical protein
VISAQSSLVADGDVAVPGARRNQRNRVGGCDERPFDGGETASWTSSLTSLRSVALVPVFTVVDAGDDPLGAVL